MEFDACQISKRYEHFNTQYRVFEILQDLKVRRLIGYWNGAGFSKPIPAQTKIAPVLPFTPSHKQMSNKVLVLGNIYMYIHFVQLTETGYDY